MAYKMMKEDAKEIAKDLGKTIKWLTKTSVKLKKFNNRDIFEEHDTVNKQIKIIAKKTDIVSDMLQNTMREVGESLDLIVKLYNMFNFLFKKVIDLEQNKVDKVSELADALQEALSKSTILGKSLPKVPLR